MEQTVKAITQETFDCVVQENVHDFEMDEAEAVTDAINQFQTQVCISENMLYILNKMQIKLCNKQQITI